MPVDKNIKCEAHELERFDNLMKNEKQLPNSRHEFLTKLMNVYESGCNTEPTIKEVIKEVVVSPENVPSSKTNKIKRTIISNGTWLLGNLQIFPSSKNQTTRHKLSEIIESANAL